MNGRVEFEGDTPLPEETEVENRPFELTEEEEEELWQAHREIERGEFVKAEELLDEIRSSQNK